MWATVSGWRLSRQVRRKVSTSLVSITATSRHRAWAVGASGSAHWHGAAWTTASFATADPFHDLAATRRGRVWRVRAVWVSGHYQPVAQRWTGTSWRRVWIPHPSIATIPISISIWSGHDIWIGVRRAGTHRYLVLHWNGRRWRRLRVPYWGGSVVTGAGRHRVWLSGSALWNGWSWIVGLPGISGLDLTGVPGTRAAWMVSTATGSGGLTRGQIWAHGRVS